MKEETIKNIIRIYALERQRAAEEIREFFKVNSMFLVIQGAFLGAMSLEVIPFPVIYILGFLTAIFWFFSNIAQMGWKRWWQGLSETLMIKVYYELGLKDIALEGKKNEPIGRLTIGITVIPMIATFCWGLFASLAVKEYLPFPEGIIIVIIACVAELIFFIHSFKYRPFEKYLEWNRNKKGRKTKHNSKKP